MFNLKLKKNRNEIEVNIEIGSKDSKPSFWSLVKTIAGLATAYAVYKFVVIVILL